MTKKKTHEPMQKRIAYAQPVFNHPVLKENNLVQRRYFSMLNSYCEKVFHISKYGRAVLNFYKSSFKTERQSNSRQPLSTKLRIVMLLDIVHISGYNHSIITKDFIRSFRFNSKLLLIIEKLFSNLCYKNPMWDELVSNRYVKSEAEWIDCIRKNVAFSQKKPYKIMVTATMSAGKSTFINALAGKRIANTNNLACTGRLHYIYSKPFDDGLTGKWDKNIIIDAHKNILTDREEIQERVSYESIYYNSGLHGKQFMILDTPGVNSAEYRRHGECTENAVKNSDYNLMIFLLNYEHIGTDDELAHIAFVRKNVPADVPVVFCVNKTDSKKKDDSRLDEKYRDIKRFLKEQGFPDSVLFFVSSRSAYLYRVRDMLTDVDDIDDLETVTRKIKRSADITDMYRKVRASHIEKYSDGFEYQCGIGYIEDYIIKLMLENERN